MAGVPASAERWRTTTAGVSATVANAIGSGWSWNWTTNRFLGRRSRLFFSSLCFLGRVYILQKAMQAGHPGPLLVRCLFHNHKQRSEGTKQRK